MRNTPVNTFNILIAAVAIASGAVITPAAAARDGDSVRVSTHDLDLSTTRGQRVLDLRISRAASALCDTTNERFDAAVRTSQRQCRQAAIASAKSMKDGATRIATR